MRVLALVFLFCSQVLFNVANAQGTPPADCTPPSISLSQSILSVFQSNYAQTTPLSFATTGSPGTYSITWDATPANNFVAVTSALLPASPISISVPAGTAPGTYTGYITVSNSSSQTSPDPYAPPCPTVSTAVSFTVVVISQDAPPTGCEPMTITLTSNALSVCQSNYAQTTPLSFTTTGSPGTYSITWDATPGFTSAANYVDPATFESPIYITVPAGTAPGTYTGYITVSNTRPASDPDVICPVTSAPARFTLTVSASGIISLTSAATTTNQSVCINNPITNITYGISGTATGATVTGLPSGVTGVYDDATKVLAISGMPSTAGTFNYTVTTTGSSCNSIANGVINVSSNGTISLTSAAGSTSQTTCINTTITNITYSIGGSATGATVTGLPSGVTGSYNAGVFTISGIPSQVGTFNYTLTTDGGCGSATASGTITVTQGATTTLAVTACNTYTWTSGTGQTYTSSGTYYSTKAGTTGCQETTVLSLTINKSPVATVSSTNVKCFGTNDGTATVTITSGVSPYTYEWTPAIGNGATVSGLAAGNYVVTITDASGCPVQKTVTISEPPALLVTETHTAAACYNGSSTVTISASGGKSPYSGIGVFTQSAGTKVYTVTDANGCTKSITVNVVAPPVITGTFNDFVVLQQGASSNTLYTGYSPASKATIKITVSGGTPFSNGAPYTYAWSSSGSAASYTVDKSDKSIITVTATGAGTVNFTVKVTDSKGCTASFSKAIYVIDVRCGPQLKNVTVCQPPTGKSTTPSTNCVSYNSVANMLASGSYLGPCQTVALTSTTSISVSGGQNTPVAKQEISASIIPNPAIHYFTVTVNSSRMNEKMTLRVIDALGRPMEVREGLMPGSTILLGEHYRPGYYFVEVRQGGQRKQLKLIKGSE